MKFIAKFILSAVIMLCSGLSAFAQSSYTVTFHDRVLYASSPRIPWYQGKTYGTVYGQTCFITPDTYYAGDKTPIINAKGEKLITISDISQYFSEKCYGALGYSKKEDGVWKQYGFAGKTYSTYQFGFVKRLRINFFMLGGEPMVTAPCAVSQMRGQKTVSGEMTSNYIDVTFDKPVNTFTISVKPIEDILTPGTSAYKKYEQLASDFATAMGNMDVSTYTDGRFFLIKSIEFREEESSDEYVAQINNMVNDYENRLYWKDETISDKNVQINQLVEEKRQMLNEDTHDVNRDGQISIADIVDEVNAVLHPLDANGHEGVSLGLPSRAIWASMNVGATAPDNEGTFFSWAETSGKASYNPEDYRFFNNNGVGYTKYYYDGSTELALEDDAAHVNWGGSWRMPSKEDFEELITYCDWEVYSHYETTYIYKVTGPNGNYILLPAVGAEASNMGSFFIASPMYWTRTLDANYAPYGLNGVNVKYNYSTGLSTEAVGTYSNRYYGFLVRPVMKR